MAVSANEQMYDRSIDRAAMLRRYEKNVEGKVFLTLDGHELRVDKLLREASLSTKGFNRLRDALDEELIRTYKTMYQTTKRSLLSLVHDQMSYTRQSLESATSGIWRTKKATRAVGEDVVLKQPLAGNRALAPAWNNVRMSEKRRLEGVIRKGISQSKGAAEIAKEVRTGSVHKITRNNSNALVVTAMTSVNAQADQAVYEANADGLDGWQYVALIDGRTTKICIHRDTHVYAVGDYKHLPPAHFYCRSTTTPVFKNWADLASLENVAQVRKRNISKLTPSQLRYYEGRAPLGETYDGWLKRQTLEVQLRHLGSSESVDLFNKGQLEGSKFYNSKGNSVGIRGLRQLTDSEFTAPNDTIKFANAKRKLDAIHLGISRPEDVLGDVGMQNRLRDYYKLQAGELDGTLSLINYRGAVLGNKRRTKRFVLTRPPTEDQLKFNPMTSRYEDVRLYQPNPYVFFNAQRLVDSSEDLQPQDKEFINKFVSSLDEYMGINERAVISDNLRIVFTRYRKNPEPWANFKAVAQAQVKFDVMNVSDAIETQIRKGSDVLKKLTQDNYIDPVLGAVQLDDLHDNFLSNIRAKNLWEDKTAPKIARELAPMLNTEIPLVLMSRLNKGKLQQFYTRFAHRLALADSPDRDQLAVAIGRDLYNMANLNGDRRKWFDVGVKLLESKRTAKLYSMETFGVQKRRMKSRMSNQYFGPYYDTLAYSLKIVDPRVAEYSKLTRKVEVGMRVSTISPGNRLIFRKGYKTYFMKKPSGLIEDTRIPITSTTSFSDFPEDLVDQSLVDAMTQASEAEYKIDSDFYDFTKKLLYFEDDRGDAKYYNSLNEYKKYMASRGDAYERLKAMEWLRKKDTAFSNNPFVDHRARIYDRGLIGPQAGETFRPFLNTAEDYAFSKDAFENFQDQVGAFLGGLDDKFEGRFNSLSITGRQKIAEKFRPDMIKIGNHMRRNKPGDIRAILEMDIVQSIDAEELGKFFRFAIETSKIDDFLTARIPTTTTLLSERQDVAGLLKLMGVNNKGDASYVGTPSEALTSQREIIRRALKGESLEGAAPWVHTADVELTKLRRERATYKTFDHETGQKFSAEKVAANKAKFVKRSGGNTQKYLAMQVVEELGELVEEQLKAIGVPSQHRSYRLIEAQKRALKVSRFGEDTIIKDVASPYYLKTNRQAADLAAKHAGIIAPGRFEIEALIEELSEKIEASIPNLKPIANVYSDSNLENLVNYKTGLALEQDASSSGAQIIALTTRNKQLAELSNVVPTNQKRRLYGLVKSRELLGRL